MKTKPSEVYERKTKKGFCFVPDMEREPPQIEKFTIQTRCSFGRESADDSVSGTSDVKKAAGFQRQSRRCRRWGRGFGEVFVLVVLVVMMMGEVGESYNVDTVTAVVHQGEPGSMFGFSVAQHIDQSTNWLLVGAPKAQTSQPGVEKGGAVFRCRTDRVNSCQEIPFDQTGNKRQWDRAIQKDSENKSHQWFGATVQSSGENGVIVACAPRYVYFSTLLDKREPVGTCYVNVASTTDYTEFSPCRAAVDDSWYSDQYHKKGYCQAGYAASFSNGGQKLLIGAVGSWYWQGQVYNYNSRDTNEYVSTREGPADEDDSYMGYASAVGDFDGDKVDDYAVGVPKGGDHLGKVVLFTQELSNINNITGEQIGAYFGSALTVSDLNEDGLDDIIIGAPFYSNFEGIDYETGRVYIYYQTEAHEFKAQKRDILDGRMSKSRFGQALASLGDINYDGYNDIAVGAPFGGKEGQGAVFIYHGSVKGIITQVSQVVEASDVGTGLSAFGSAMSGGWDQDANLYPDLIVGAYGSDKAVFLKTRPVVKVYASLRIDPKDINLEEKLCRLKKDIFVPCMNVYSCLEYDGVGVPDELYFDASWELDVLQRNLTVSEQRAFFLDDPASFKETKTYKLTYKNIMCASSSAIIQTDLLDKLTPIAVDFKFKLHEEDGSSRQRREVTPVLDQYIPTSVRTEAHILKECGKDNRCIPNLVLKSFRISAAHIIGSREALEIMVIVENQKEDAFNTKLFITLPPGVTFTNKAAVSSVVPVGCGAMGNIAVCDIGNPLPSGEKTRFTLRVTAKDTNETSDSLKFYLVVNSTNPEELLDTLDNDAEVEIPVTASADITVYGASKPEQMILNTSRVALRGVDFDHYVEHTYQLQNLGPSSTKQIKLQILWPSHDRDGNPILELEGKLKINGTGTCSVIVITPYNATKYGFDQRNGEDLQIYLPSDQDDLEKSKKGDSVMLACSSRHCTVIQCLVGYLEKNDNFFITIRSKLNVWSMLERRDNAQAYLIRSSASARIVSLPYKLASVNVSRFAMARESIITTVNTDRLKPGSKKVEIWVIVLAIIGGILLLLLLVLLLWCCGFFKRRKPEDEGYMVAGVTSANDDMYRYE
ncbi:integrin alpha-8-like isoform X2 [Babylonia areolata]|uniref:integrin alpha-8-like isoform X2 n=1 Tax=Babylonia areolata TaxID=304850 RepID=UPI003FCFE802